MKHSKNEVLLHTKDVFKKTSVNDSIDFVRAIIEQLNNEHGDSEAFEFATLYFP
jgi:hypothetical protein